MGTRATAPQCASSSIERVRSTPRYALTEDEHPHVERVCRLVNGMPLGIELAAAWASTLPCREIADEIERNLGFLETSMQDVPERHRSLRAAFDQSWRLLSDDERRVFSRLAVFRGTFARDAAATVSWRGSGGAPRAGEQVTRAPLRTRPLRAARTAPPVRGGASCSRAGGARRRTREPCALLRRDDRRAVRRSARREHDGGARRASRRDRQPSGRRGMGRHGVD